MTHLIFFSSCSCSSVVMRGSSSAAPPSIASSPLNSSSWPYRGLVDRSVNKKKGCPWANGRVGEVAKKRAFKSCADHGVTEEGCHSCFSPPSPSPAPFHAEGTERIFEKSPKLDLELQNQCERPNHSPIVHTRNRIYVILETGWLEKEKILMTNAVDCHSSHIFASVSIQTMHSWELNKRNICSITVTDSLVCVGNWCGSGCGLMVRIHDLRAASRGFESQKSQRWWREGHPTLIRSWAPTKSPC